jgi:hypothetical protein
MPETKAAKKSTSAKEMKIKVHKSAQPTKKPSTAQRAAAVEENLGRTQSLRDFLSEIGWR